MGEVSILTKGDTRLDQKDIRNLKKSNCNIKCVKIDKVRGHQMAGKDNLNASVTEAVGKARHHGAKLEMELLLMKY